MPSGMAQREVWWCAVKMPFGKYKGQDFEDLPTAYLQWMAEEFHGRASLQQEAENQLALREGRGVERDQVGGSRHA